MSEKRSDSVWLVVVFVILIGVLPLLMWGSWIWHMPGGMGMMGYGWGFMFLAPLLFLVLIGLGVYYLITEFMSAGKSATGGGRALEFLNEQYAKGAITREQYLKMKEDLEG